MLLVVAKNLNGIVFECRIRARDYLGEKNLIFLLEIILELGASEMVFTTGSLGIPESSPRPTPRCMPENRGREKLAQLPDSAPRPES